MIWLCGKDYQHALERALSSAHPLPIHWDSGHYNAGECTLFNRRWRCLVFTS